MNIFKNLFTEKSDNCVCAPVDGFCTDIIKCSDKTFANKMLGDGFMIMPTNNIVCSPCDGELTMMFPTLHAFGLKMSNGQEILVHIGINTVELKGNFFEKLCEINEIVKKGTPIIDFNYKEICKLGYDPSVLVILVNKKEVLKKNILKEVKANEIIIEG